MRTLAEIIEDHAFDSIEPLCRSLGFKNPRVFREKDDYLNFLVDVDNENQGDANRDFLLEAKIMEAFGYEIKVCVIVSSKLKNLERDGVLNKAVGLNDIKTLSPQIMQQKFWVNDLTQVKIGKPDKAIMDKLKDDASLANEIQSSTTLFYRSMRKGGTEVVASQINQDFDNKDVEVKSLAAFKELITIFSQFNALPDESLKQLIINLPQDKKRELIDTFPKYKWLEALLSNEPVKTISSR